MKRIICLLLIILITSGCGILVPYTREDKNIPETHLSWYSILYSMNINKDQKEIKRRWNEYREKLDEYKNKHPKVEQEIIEKMAHCIVVLGMTEEQVLFMAQPQSILKSANPNEKIFVYSAKFKREGTGTKTWITITDGIVTKIDEEVTAYGW